MIFYFRTSDLDSRNQIDEFLKVAGFQWIEMTGGQACYEESSQSFTVFRSLVEGVSKAYGFGLLEVKECEDPGLGLFCL